MSLAKMSENVEKASTHKVNPAEQGRGRNRGADLRGAAHEGLFDSAACARLAPTDLRQPRRDVGADGPGRLGCAAEPRGMGAGGRRAQHRNDRLGLRADALSPRIDVRVAPGSVLCCQYLAALTRADPPHRVAGDAR